jgi:hypothetical protein
MRAIIIIGDFAHTRTVTFPLLSAPIMKDGSIGKFEMLNPDDMDLNGGDIGFLGDRLDDLNAWFARTGRTFKAEKPKVSLTSPAEAKA